MFCPVINLAKQLVSCPSISPIDYGCQNIILSRLKKIGFVIEKINIKETSNFFAWKGTGKKTLLFVGHTDVVSIGEEKKWTFPPFNLTMDRNGMLFGRGIADMKGALAAMIIATERFIKKYQHHNRLAFLITSDEESDGLNGTVKVVNKLIERKEKIDYCLVGEPTSNIILGDNIKNGRRGSLNCTLTIYGEQSHVAYAKINNPIHNVLPFLNELLNTVWDKGNKFFPSTKMQITNFTVNNCSVNIIPEKCFIKFNFRFSSELTDNIIKNRVINILNNYKINYDISWQTSGHPFLTEKGNLLDTIIEVIEYFNNIKPTISTDGGTSDGRFIAGMGSVQIVEFGLVNSTIHKINECVKSSDLFLLSLMYQKILEKLLVVNAG